MRGSDSENHVVISSKVNSLGFGGEGGDDILTVNGDVRYGEYSGGDGYDKLILKGAPLFVIDALQVQYEGGESLRGIVLSNPSVAQDNFLPLPKTGKRSRSGKLPIRSTTCGTLAV